MESSGRPHESARAPEARRRELSDEEYRRLAELRHGQRRFLHWSAERAALVGLTATQHQLLLGIRAWPPLSGPTIGDVAEFLFIRHHSAVELVDRAERAGLVVRARSDENAGEVWLTITPEGAERLRALTELHLRELAELAPRMSALWDAVAEVAAHAPPENPRHGNSHLPPAGEPKGGEPPSAGEPPSTGEPPSAGEPEF